MRVLSRVSFLRHQGGACLVLAALASTGLPAAPLEARVQVGQSVPQTLASAPLLGRTAASLRLEGMVLPLKRSPETQASLDAFLAQVQDPASPFYHRWLSPEGFGRRFGPSEENLATVLQWLRDQGFTLDRIAPGRMSIQFSGTRDQVEWAFQTVLMDYEVEGARRHANATPISIPRALAGMMAGPISLTDIPRLRSDAHRIPLPAGGPSPQFNLGQSHYLAPGDFATIYNLKPLYQSGLDGTGTAIAVAGRSRISASDIATFRASFALPANPPAIVLAGSDPGRSGNFDEAEALLDVTWAGAVAPLATVKLVIAASTTATDGIDLANDAIVNGNLAPILSLSYGLCEASMGSAWATQYYNLWSQAAAQGITVCVASGDSGSAACDSATAFAGSERAVSGLASPPYSVAVGGTQFTASGAYWNSTNDPGDKSSAKSYIPESAWNESSLMPGGSGLWAGGGGASMLWSRPAWQTVPGSLTPDGKRNLPDVSLAAAKQNGYLAYQDGQLVAFAGTSASAPAFAAIMSIVVQQYGRQGNPNPVLYRLGNAQYGSGTLAPFHDVTTGNTNVSGVSGYSAGIGYDPATGLGSVDAASLVANWQALDTSPATGPRIAAQPQSQAVLAPDRATFAVTAVGGGNLAFQWQRSTDGTTWTNVPGGSGGTTATYTTAATSGSDNGAIFRVKITDSRDTTYSAPARLAVGNSGVALAASPAEPATPVNNRMVFTASIVGSTGITWTASRGSIAYGTDATSVIWTAPAATGPVQVTATSQADPSKTATFTVQVTSLDLVLDRISPDTLDLSILSGAYGTRSFDAGGNLPPVPARADLNGDGVVDLNDLNLFLSLSDF